MMMMTKKWCRQQWTIELIADKQKSCWWARNHLLHLYSVLNKLLFKKKEKRKNNTTEKPTNTKDTKTRSRRQQRRMATLSTMPVTIQEERLSSAEEHLHKKQMVGQERRERWSRNRNTRTELLTWLADFVVTQNQHPQWCHPHCCCFTRASLQRCHHLTYQTATQVNHNTALLSSRLSAIQRFTQAAVVHVAHRWPAAALLMLFCH